jgi:hypothetical protein
VRDPYTVILSESGPKQCRSSMNNSQNSASLKSSIFRKPDQQRKVSKSDEAPRPRYNEISKTTPNQYTENWEKKFGTPPQEVHQRNFDQRSTQGSQRGGAPNQGRGRGPYTLKPPYCMYHGSSTNHHTKDCPIYLETKKKMERDSTHLRTNPRPEKSITPCNGHLTTRNIPHPTLRIFHHKLIITIEPNPQHSTSHTTTPQSTILNLHQLYR